MLAFSHDPQSFINNWLMSQMNDLKVKCHADLVNSCHLLWLHATNSTCVVIVERGSSAVECWIRNRKSPGSNPPLLPFRRSGILVLPSSVSCINECVAIDSGGNVSDLVLARNCCMTRMLPGEVKLVSE